MKKVISKIVLLLLLLMACHRSESITIITGGDQKKEEQGKTIEIPASNPDAKTYMELYEPIADAGHYYMPESTQIPKKFWTCVDIQNREDRNEPGLSDMTRGLQYHLLSQSIAGLVNKALDEGKTEIGVWLEANGEAYDLSKSAIGQEIGRQTGIELTSKTYGPFEGLEVNVRNLFSGYVLTDVKSNPESNTVATVASHIYNAIIVDVRDKAYFDSQGYSMLYDARAKSTADAWHEFKDKCSNKALVVMPVQTGELREFAIKNKLFCINLNKKYGNPASGQNIGIFEEVLAWLAPNAPILGWEQGVGEDAFVAKISKSGKLMLAADWSYNHSLTSAGGRGRQKQILANVINPRDINYSENKHYISFFLSDGDNYQWVMGGGFVNDYFNQPESETVNMGYGLCSQALCELAPSQYENIMSRQKENNTFMECFGGGYYYADTYSSNKNRTENLKTIARRTAAHMKQHRLKILHIIAWDTTSPATKEACQAFIDANEQLEGIVAIQYSPYNGGKGEILWCKNKEGYEIPIVTTKYSLWKGGSNGQGSPVEIGARMKSLEKGRSHAFVCVHAWSDFSGAKGAQAASTCINAAGSSFKAVSVQELIWRIRMKEREEQTLKYLATIK
jgi:hypothetical protein